jgi:hypothetical protein
MPKSGSYVDGSAAHAYSSLKELAHDASAVVRLSFTGQVTVEHVGTAPFSVNVMHVDQVLRGSLPSITVKLRTLGAPPGSTEASGATTLTQGVSYIVFVTPFTFGPGSTTDQYVIVGGRAGLFRVDQGNVVRLDHDSTQLPASLPVSDFENRLS